MSDTDHGAEWRLGGLFEGYGGLTMAAQAVLDCEPAWFVENDPGACAVLDEHHPDIPNLGDITAVDWARVEPVDVLTAGFPCQDISSAGRRAGIEGERSGLWSHVVDAYRVLRPRYLLAENVSALVVRGFDRVLADLAALGLDAEWCCVPASAVGAPHGRDRWFLVAADAAHVGHERRGPARRRWERSSDDCEPATDAEGDGRHEGRAESARLERRPDAAERGGSAAGPDIERCGTWGWMGRAAGSATVRDGAPDWGDYAPAIARWGHNLGRPAPAPTQRGRRGGDVLSPVFVEWHMGLPEGWVTDVPGLSRNQQLKLLGNGVVPQQAAAAYAHLLGRFTSGGVAECIA